MGGDHGRGVALFKRVAEMIGTECLVCQQGAEGQILDEFRNPDVLAALSWQERESDQVS